MLRNGILITRSARFCGRSLNLIPKLSFSASVNTRLLSSSAKYSEFDYHGFPLNSSRLPRYLRRANNSLVVTERRQASKPTTGSSTTTKTFRSRHYDPIKANERDTKKKEGGIKLLEPHTLSKRLKALCDVGQLDAAVNMLKSAPLDAQSTPVWNTLIWECMKAHLFRLGYMLFVDMKRRGHSPTSRTFQSLFSGYSKIENWSLYTKQLGNVKSIYEGFQRHIASLKKHEPNSPDITAAPLAPYIKLLGDAGLHHEIFDVYYTLDSNGPYSANQLIYTAMFGALSSPTNKGETKPFVDVKLLWAQALKASQRSGGFEVDGHLVTAVISAVERTGTQPADYALAFQLIQKYFGLSPPGEPMVHGTIPLVAQSIASILLLCNKSGHHAHAIHYLQQLRHRPPAMGDVSLLDRRHMEEILKAHIGLTPAEPNLGAKALDILEFMLVREIAGVRGAEKNGPKIRPALSTYNLVLYACWKSADWKSGARAFEVMSGYHLEDFSDYAMERAAAAAGPDGKPHLKVKLDRRTAGRNVAPTAETISSLVRCAIDSSNTQAYTSQCLEPVRQALRLVEHLGGVKAIGGRRAESAQAVSETAKTLKNWAFHASKLAYAVNEAVQLVFKHEALTSVPWAQETQSKGSGNKQGIDMVDEQRTWSKLSEEARSVYRLSELEKKSMNGQGEFIPTTNSSLYGESHQQQ